jgi:MYXO-CTERM domain-containing protein
VACSKPEGAIFCNGQYVNATNAKECIAYLATRQIKVDTSASGSLSCTGTDCAGIGSVKGCSSGASANGYGYGAFAVLAMALTRRISRRRKS